MKIAIARNGAFVEYNLESASTLLDALEQIKATQDATLSFSYGCRSGVCGSCGVRINGKEGLACTHKVFDGDRVEPLKYLPIVRDLVVDMEAAETKLKSAKAYLMSYQEAEITKEEALEGALESDCILCGCCYSVCPVLSVDGQFLGPFALMRAWRYVSDPREGDAKSKIDSVIEHGIWDCTLCNECTLVCPQSISPKSDIEKLRIKAAQYGYMDPNLTAFSGGFDASLGF